MTNKSKYNIVVWLDENYTKSDTFECSTSLSKDLITEEVNKRYPLWYYYDIW
jgi:hypothetical protein